MPYNYQVTIHYLRDDFYEIEEVGPKEGFATVEHARDVMNKTLRTYKEEQANGDGIEEHHTYEGELFELNDGVWVTYLPPMEPNQAVAPATNKRKEPESESKQEVPAVNWRKFDGTALIARFQKSTGAYGGTNIYLSLPGASSVAVTMPWSRVEFEPSVWDEAKQAKYGKEKDADGKIKKLDPNRKKDKCSMTLNVSEAWSNWWRAYKLSIAQRLFEQRAVIFKDQPDLKAIESARELLTSFEAGVKQNNSGDYLFKLDMTTDVGAQDTPLKLYAHDTKEELPSNVRLGRGSEVAVVLDLGYARIGQKIKIYAVPSKVYVRTAVAPKNDSAYVPEFDDE